jgi:hypothetical protein
VEVLARHWRESEGCLGLESGVCRVRCVEVWGLESALLTEMAVVFVGNKLLEEASALSGAPAARCQEL